MKQNHTPKARQAQIETAISDLIDNVERFFGIAPFRFLDVELDGSNDHIGYFTFLNERKTRHHRFEPWFQHLLETLDPYVHEDEEKAKAAEKVIEAVLPQSGEVRRAWGEVQDSLGELQYPARRVGFYAGVFIGAKLQGASRADLARIGEALTVPCVEEWKTVRAMAKATEKYQAEQKAKVVKADPAKKIDRLASEFGKTVKGMTSKQKREYAAEGGSR
jgi:hypothetical protein